MAIRGYFSAPVSAGAVIGICSFGDDGNLVELKLHPITMIRKPRSRAGLPMSTDADTARKIIKYLEELSAPFGTTVEFRDGVGIVKF